jgi:hypothetical protein
MLGCARACTRPDVSDQARNIMDPPSGQKLIDRDKLSPCHHQASRGQSPRARKLTVDDDKDCTQAGPRTSTKYKNVHDPLLEYHVPAIYYQLVHATSKCFL